MHTGGGAMLPPTQRQVHVPCTTLVAMQKWSNKDSTDKQFMLWSDDKAMMVSFAEYFVTRTKGKAGLAATREPPKGQMPRHIDTCMTLHGHSMVEKYKRWL